MKRTPFFRHDRWLELLLTTIATYLDQFQLHDFVIMPDHIHLLLTPAGPLERSAQLIKGGFSYRAKRELSWPSDIWQAGYSDHRIRDTADYHHHVAYIAINFSSLGEQENPLRHSSGKRLPLTFIPPWLKPLVVSTSIGAAEAAPFQNRPVFPPEQTQRD